MPEKPTNGTSVPVESLIASSVATSGILAFAAEVATAGPIFWSGTVIPIPLAPAAMASLTAVIAAFASLSTLTTLMSAPSAVAFSVAPAAWSMKYCCVPSL